MQHYGVHVRCLVAIPLLVLAEASLHGAAQAVMAQIELSGVVGPAAHAGFDRSIESLHRVRDASLPWVIVTAGALAWTVANHPDPHGDARAWAVDADGGLGFGGWWFAYVARPLLLTLLLGWLWRILLVAWWFWRIGQVGLAIVPTHPDRAGGLAFLEKVPAAFALVTFSISSVIASRWAHEIFHHGAALQSFRVPAIVFVIAWSLVTLLPLFALAPMLSGARRQAILQYSALVGEQGRFVDRRWIHREPVADQPILDAPQIGPVADAAALYDAVKRMRKVPISRGSMALVVVPMLVPMIVVALLQIPLKDVLLKLLKALV